MADQDEATILDIPDELADRIADDLVIQFYVSDAATVVEHVAGELLRAGWSQPAYAAVSGGAGEQRPGKGFRVTVEDLERGGSQSMVVAEGDYMLIPFAPCYLHYTSRSAKGTVSITLRNHAPRKATATECGDH
jgi:hypothetical protein